MRRLKQLDDGIGGTFASTHRKPCDMTEGLRDVGCESLGDTIVQLRPSLFWPTGGSFRLPVVCAALGRPAAQEGIHALIAAAFTSRGMSEIGSDITWDKSSARR